MMLSNMGVLSGVLPRVLSVVLFPVVFHRTPEEHSQQHPNFWRAVPKALLGALLEVSLFWELPVLLT